MASTAKLIRLDFEVFGKVQGNTIINFEIVIGKKLIFNCNFRCFLSKGEFEFFCMKLNSTTCLAQISSSEH